MKWANKEVSCLEANWNKRAKELSRILKRTPQSIHHKKLRLGLVRNIKVDWNKEKALTYVFGVYMGDGYVDYFPEHSLYRITLTVKDKNFARRFFDELKTLNLNPHLHRRKDGCWGVWASSKEFANYLKSLTISEVRDKLREREVKSAFLAGFFDAEGGVKEANGTLQLRISNTNKELINFVSELSKELGYTLTKSERRLPSNKAYFTLSLCNRRNVGSFLNEISPSREVI